MEGAVMKVRIDDGSNQHDLSVRRIGEGQYEITRDGVTHVVAAQRRGRGEWVLGTGPTQRVWASQVIQDRVSLACGGEAWALSARDASRGNHGGQGEASQGHVATPMPGVVVRIAVAEGDVVQKGQVLCVVEAMKMENEYRADVDGTIDIVHISAGQALDAGASMITIRPDES
jgi:biotin carboxyl carrier protein